MCENHSYLYYYCETHSVIFEYNQKDWNDYEHIPKFVIDSILKHCILTNNMYF